MKCICLMQNESNCSAAHHIKQIMMKNGKAWEHTSIFINWIWVRACDPCATITQTPLTLRGRGASTEKPIQFENADKHWHRAKLDKHVTLLMFVKIISVLCVSLPVRLYSECSLKQHIFCLIIQRCQVKITIYKHNEKSNLFQECKNIVGQNCLN